METQVKQLKLKRLSSVPNKYGTYAYEIVNAEEPAVAELLDQVAGIVEGREGGKLVYSRNRIGTLGVAKNVAIRLNESRDKDTGEGTGNFYINLSDSGLESAGDFFDKVKLAEQFGVKNSAAAVAAFYGTKGTAIPAATVEAEETANTEAKAETPLQNAGA